MNTQISLDISDELHCVINLQGEILSLNQKFADVLYMRQETLYGKNFYELLPTQQRSVFIEFVNQLPTQKVRNFQTEILNTLQEAIQVRGKIIIDTQQIVYLSGSIFLSQEARLARFKRFFDLSLLEMVISIDVDGKFTYFNRGFADMLGYTSQEINQFNFFEMIDERDVQNTHNNLAMLKTHEGITRNFNNMCKHNNGSCRIISWRITFNKDAYYAVGTDITEQEEQRVQNDKLLKDLETQNEEQKQTLHELKTRNFELDQFVYKVSHDLRAPLTSIMGLINLSRIDGDTFEKMHQYIDLIEGSTQKLDNFITSLLEYSRSNRHDMEAQKIEFEQLVEDSLEDLKYIQDYSKLQIAISVTQGEVDFFAEQIKLNIIFNNIISNAVKYQNKRITDNTLKIAIDLTSPKFAHITVRDNGIGIHKRYLDQVFDMFFRATETSAGSGLGLYIVKQAVERLGGTIEINSEVGEFTEIIMQIPNRNTALKP